MRSLSANARGSSGLFATLEWRARAPCTE
jgi:hypothetical protein